MICVLDTGVLAEATVELRLLVHIARAAIVQFTHDGFHLPHLFGSRGQLLTALDEFPVGLFQLPGPLWIPPTITDGANASYNSGRISTGGVLSPQSLGKYLVGRGDLRLFELNSILRANRMDEVP